MYVAHNSKINNVVDYNPFVAFGKYVNISSFSKKTTNANTSETFYF